MEKTESGFPIHSVETALEESRDQLAESEKAYGMIPNLHRILAEAPEALKAYKQVGNAFMKSSLSSLEQNIVWLEITIRNECRYCIPAHTAIAYGVKVPAEIIDALRASASLADGKLEALRRFTGRMVDQRGKVSPDDLTAFLEAGYTRQNALEVVTGIAHKILSNYANHLAATPVDEGFKAFLPDES